MFKWFFRRRRERGEALTPYDGVRRRPLSKAARTRKGNRGRQQTQPNWDDPNSITRYGDPYDG